jgi:hypothetical protein
MHAQQNCSFVREVMTKSRRNALSRVRRRVAIETTLPDYTT